MRSPRHRWGVVALVGGLAAAGLGAVISVTAGADPPGGAPPGGGTAHMPAAIAARLSHFDLPGRGHVDVEDDTLATGDHLMTYAMNGHGKVKLRDRASCRGQSRGMAQVTQPSAGVYEISGVASLGAQGLTIALADGTVVQPQLTSPGPGEYPFFDVQVSSPPVAFDTAGVPPHGCAPPDQGADS